MVIAVTAGIGQITQQSVFVLRATDASIPPAGNYWKPVGTDVGTTTEANHKTSVLTGFTWKGLAQYVQSNISTAGSNTSVTRINQANGTQAVTFNSGQTGLFSDTSNVDSVGSGDLIDYAVSAQTLNNTTVVPWWGSITN